MDPDKVRLGEERGGQFRYGSRQQPADLPDMTYLKPPNRPVHPPRLRPRRREIKGGARAVDHRSTLRPTGRERSDYGQVALAAAAIITVTDVGLGAYDADNNEVIDRDEALAAVAAYLQGVISKEEALAVIKLYFAS